MVEDCQTLVSPMHAWCYQSAGPSGRGCGAVDICIATGARAFAGAGTGTLRRAEEPVEAAHAVPVRRSVESLCRRASLESHLLQELEFIFSRADVVRLHCDLVSVEGLPRRGILLLFAALRDARFDLCAFLLATPPAECWQVVLALLLASLA